MNINIFKIIILVCSLLLTNCSIKNTINRGCLECPPHYDLPKEIINKNETKK